MIIPVIPQCRRCWRAKVCWPSIAAAEREAERLAAQNHRRGEIRPGVLTIYFCVQHCNFHVGHRAIKELPS